MPAPRWSRSRRFRPSLFRRALPLFVTVAVILTLRLALGPWFVRDSASQSPAVVVAAGGAQVPAEGVYAVERVIDGDTLLLADQTRVRLIGVDTPECVQPEHPVEPWAPEASEFTRAFVAGGQVRLQLDRERLDRHGRLLAYVWVDERLLNEQLLFAGLARYEPQFHYAEGMKRRFRKAEAQARAARVGLWSAE